MKALVTRGKVIRYTHKWSSFKYRGSWPGNLEHQSSVSALTHTVQLALALVKLLILDLAVVAFIQTVGSSLKLTHVFLTVAYIILIQCVNEH